MIRDILRQYLAPSPEFRELLARLGAGEEDLRVGGAIGSLPAFLTGAMLEARGGTILAVTADEPEADNLYNDLESLLGLSRIALFPGVDLVPYEDKFPSPEVIGRRMETLLRLRSGEPLIIVAPARALLYRTMSTWRLERSITQLKVGDICDQVDFARMLISYGFHRVPTVSEVGQFSIRGGILDIFPFTASNPVRVELYGDEVETIRTFKVTTQRSLEELTEVRIVPTAEFTALDILDSPRDIAFPAELPIERRPDYSALASLWEQLRKEGDLPGMHFLAPLFGSATAWLTDHLPSETIVVLREPEEIRDRIERFRDEAEYLWSLNLRRGRCIFPPEMLFPSPDQAFELLGNRPKVRLEQMPLGVGKGISLPTRTPPEVRGNLDLLAEHLQLLNGDGYAIHLLSDTEGARKRLQSLMTQSGTEARFDVDTLSGGFLHTGLHLALMVETQLFGRIRTHRRKRRYQDGITLTSFTALSVGDFVVHVDHGVAKFTGLTRITSGERHRDCLTLLYAEGDKLYVPVEEFHRIQKYVGKDGEVTLARLRSGTWERTKARIKRELMEMAQEIISIQARRKALPGLACGPDESMQQTLEATFMYEETEDQLKAIEEIKGDMMNPYPMDRLLCGDVGFGKTEVALRAAFKAAVNGYQVAVLVPTTILAQQHLQTFSERLRGFPVQVDVLSRFKKPKEQKLTLEAVSSGRADILIGTHRLLSKDVRFKNLGLLIIDEEHRFGVTHKERLKKLRSDVDVLSMTATPIPRTLQMSLGGIRDMSVISIPPKDRQPVLCEIAQFGDMTFIEPIQRELARGGQVFVVHNRIETIHSMAGYLRRILPEVRFGVSHGQMEPEELEDVLLRFLNRELDVLVTTSIIESGMDMPNVNTIIINRADRFGMAQLYQLKGRVGRADVRAYAYLITPVLTGLDSIARKRLAAIVEHQELGAGFLIAMRDLEIRGAGNILGSQQSGFIEEIGYELYMQMLQESIAELQGKPIETRPVVEMHIDLPGFLHTAYVSENTDRIDLYQRLFRADSLVAIDEIEAEIRDRFGPLPEPAEILLDTTRIRFIASKYHIERLEIAERRMVFSLPEGLSPESDTFSHLLLRLRSHFRIEAKARIAVVFDLEGWSDLERSHSAKKVLLELEEEDNL